MSHTSLPLVGRPTEVRPLKVFSLSSRGLRTPPPLLEPNARVNVTSDEPRIPLRGHHADLEGVEVEDGYVGEWAAVDQSSGHSSKCRCHFVVMRMAFSNSEILSTCFVVSLVAVWLAHKKDLRLVRLSAAWALVLGLGALWLAVDIFAHLPPVAIRGIIAILFLGGFAVYMGKLSNRLWEGRGRESL